MDKIKILQFPMTNSFSGVNQYVLENWRFIDKTRFHFDFATCCREKLYFEDEVTAQGCIVYHVSCYAEEDKQQFSKEIKEILSNGYHTVHLNTTYWKSFLVEELAREAGIPQIIIHAHNSSVNEVDHREERIADHKQWVEKLTESIATDFWACSWTAAEWLFGNSIPKEKIVIQKNAIAIDRFRYNPETAKRIRKQLGWEKQYIIGHVGRFSYQKNHSFLIKVFREVHKKNPNTRLLLVGIGPERKNVDRMIDEWNLQDAVKILERRNDVYNLLQAIDCFVLPSHFEGYPIVLVEAQASGCDCLISDLITEEAILTDNVTRLPLKETIWIDELIKLSGNRTRRHTNHADVICKQGYDIKKQIIRIEEGYCVHDEHNQ